MATVYIVESANRVHCVCATPDLARKKAAEWNDLLDDPGDECHPEFATFTAWSVE